MLSTDTIVSPTQNASDMRAVYCLPVDDLRDRLLIASMIARYSGMSWHLVTQAQAQARHGCWVSPSQPSIVLLSGDEVVAVLIGRMSKLELRRAVDGVLAVH